MNKSFSQRKHAKKRLLQRFGILANREKYKQLCTMIMSGHSIPIVKQSNRISIHEVEFEGKKLKCVYDRNRHNIVSVLTERMRVC